MFFSPFIALRYLKPKRTFVSIITVISVLGVTLGVWLLTVVIAVFSGYGEKIKENILGFEPHLEIRAGGYIEDFVPLMEKLQNTEGVVSASPFVWGSVIMEYQGMRNAPIIRAIDPPKPGSEDYERFSNKMAKRNNPDYDPKNAKEHPKMIPAGEFHLDPYSVVVGDAMAQNLGLDVGAKLLLYSPKDMESIMAALDEVEKGDDEQRAAAKQKVRDMTVPQEVTVTGIFDSGNWDVDANLIFLALETGQVLYNFDLEECHGIAIRTSDAFQADQYKDNILVDLDMGELKTASFSPAAVSNQEVFRWSPLTVFLFLLALSGVALSQTVFKKNRLPVLISTVGLAFVVLLIHWVSTFSSARDSLSYVEQTGGLPYQLLTWMQIHKLIFDAIAAERQAMYLILFMIMIVGGFCIMNTMITVTFQKRSEIGLMKALGAKESQIAWLFLLQGMFVGLIGVIVGLLLAQFTIWQRNNLAEFVGGVFGVDLFSAEIYKIDGGLPASQTWSDLATISIGAFIACTLAALIPAVIAANLQPAKALRSE
ncbi:MAG: ABC transporter permease [Verrucomicrobiales bacterium]|nr:ABC transporter permease [Verrucomicrobiales bacterium]